MFKSATARRLRCEPAHLVLLAVWGCFLVRGFYYASLLPVWEGFDEWSHFAYAQHIATTGTLPVPERTQVSREVQESLLLAPLPWTFRDYPPPHMVHDQYWELPEAERQRRAQQLLSLPPEWAHQTAEGGPIIYEVQHPPLYYWLASWPIRWFSQASLPDRVMLLRWLNVVIASLFLPLGFLAGKRFLHSEETALGVVTLATAMPELMANVCRVSNEGLALILFTLILYCALGLAEQPQNTSLACGTGLVLGLGLLTKAYFLTAAPALGLVFAWGFRRHAAPRKDICVSAALTGLLAAAISIGWYWRNHRLTGSWMALGEELALKDVSLWDRLAQAPRVDWVNVLDTILFSHIWIGNWSFLLVRSWMYRFFELAAAAALIGLMVQLWRMRKASEAASPLCRPEHFLAMAALYGFFWIGLAYHALLIYLARGVSVSNGWYMYCLVVAEVCLATLGLFTLVPGEWSRWILPAGAVCFVLLDLYTAHFILMPYYSGLISHRPNGFLASFHLIQLREVGLGEMFARLSANKPVLLSAGALIALWAFYLAATLGLVALALGKRKSAQRVAAP